MWLKRVELDESFCSQMDELVDDEAARNNRRGRPMASRVSYDDDADSQMESDDDDGIVRKPSSSPSGSRYNNKKQENNNNHNNSNHNHHSDSSWCHSLARRLLLLFCKFSYIKLTTTTTTGATNNPQQQQQLAAAAAGEPKGDQSATKARMWRWRWGPLLAESWPKLVALAYLASAISLSLALYRHYVHDQYAFHLRRLRQARETNQHHVLADYRRMNVSERGLEQRRAQALASLRPLGAPYLEATYAPECCYLFLLINTFNIYVLLNGYVNWVRPIDCHLFRYLLDRRAERRNFNRLICQQCNKYVQSACNFTEALIRRCIQLNGYQSFKPERLAANSELRRLLLDYRATIGRLKAMALAGSLQPLNKTDRYLDLLAYAYLLIVAGLLGAGLATIVLALVVIPRASRFPVGGAPSDLLAQLELVWLWCMVCLEAAVYVTFTLMNSLDQALLIRRLMGQVQACISDNTRLFYENFQIVHDWRRALSADGDDDGGARQQLSSSNCPDDQKQLAPSTTTTTPTPTTTSGRRQLVATMNQNLLAVLMHYKIFAAKLRPIQKSFGVVCLAGLVITFSLPLLTRLHVPYMSSSVKLYIVAVGTGVIMLTNTCIAPVCLLNVQCLKLYRRLWTLLAHTIDVTSNSEHQHQQQPGGANSLARIYDRHTVWMLRKELNHPDRLVDQFATSALGLNFTYSNLIRIHFWYGLIILSILTDVRSDQEELVGSLTNDPLGIFGLRFDAD